MAGGAGDPILVGKSGSEHSSRVKTSHKFYSSKFKIVSSEIAQFYIKQAL